MSAEYVREVLAGVEPVSQPSPARNEGGDCFACAILAVVRHLWPEADVGFDASFDAFEGRWATETYKPPPTNNTWRGLEQALHRLPVDAELEYEMPVMAVPFAPGDWGYGWPLVYAGTGYAKRLQAWLSAGWIAMTTVHFEAASPTDLEGRIHVPDHFVVLDGARTYLDADESGCGPWTGDVHVVCSVRGAYWQPVGEFERRHGGANWMLVRRRYP